MNIDYDRLRKLEEKIELPRPLPRNYVPLPKFETFDDEIFFLRTYAFSRYSYYGQDIFILINNVLDELGEK